MEGEVEDEDLIQREDVVVTVSHRGYIKRVPLSTYRAQRRGGKGRAGHVDARRGCGHADLHRLHAHAGAVLLLARHGLPHEGVAPAGSDAAVARQGAGQPAAAGRRRGHHLHPAAAGGREDLGHAGTDVRHPQRQRAPQQPGGLREHQPQRQDRHEARRGRQHRAGGDLPVGWRRSCPKRPPTAKRRRAACGKRQHPGQRAAHHRAGPLHPLPRRRRAPVQGPRLSRRARHPARQGRRR